ncbi:MAG: hypothetical protein RJB13_2604 [Pseudomonadota bacterium]|jgi:hypothetical protein
MTSPKSPADSEDFSQVLTAFVELRSRGVAVSRQDLEVLNGWAAEGFSPSAVIDCIVAIHQDCEEKGIKFASSLKALDQPIRTAIRRSTEY